MFSDVLWNLIQKNDQQGKMPNEWGDLISAINEEKENIYECRKSRRIKPVSQTIRI